MLLITVKSTHVDADERFRCCRGDGFPMRGDCVASHLSRRRRWPVTRLLLSPMPEVNDVNECNRLDSGPRIPDGLRGTAHYAAPPHQGAGPQDHGTGARGSEADDASRSGRAGAL